MARRTKILIDCDPGHDDAVAVLFAARHLDLLAVTTVHGNNSLANTTRNALAVIELAGIDVPVAAGCSEPLVQRSVHIGHIHGKTGLDGADIPAPTHRPIETVLCSKRHHSSSSSIAACAPVNSLNMGIYGKCDIGERVLAQCGTALAKALADSLFSRSGNYATPAHGAEPGDRSRLAGSSWRS